MGSQNLLPNNPSFGTSIPDLPHAISVHLPKWDDVVDAALGKQRAKDCLKGGYPRSVIHSHVDAVHQAVIDKFGSEYAGALVFPAREHVDACKKYISSADAVDKTAVGSIKTLAFDIGVQSADEGKQTNTPSRQTFYAVLFPTQYMTIAKAFWRITGCGISSRLATRLLPGLGSMSLSEPEHAIGEFTNSSAAETIIKHRIAALLDRSPVSSPRKKLMRPDDVYLYPGGMAAIYNLTNALRGWPGSQSVVFGFPYELTVKVQQDFAKAATFYGFGTTQELDKFEELLCEKSKADPSVPPVQAVWCECASNPLLRTVDLERIRRLATQFGFLVIVDDTIGSFANVDVLDVADIVLTSLTKSFNGYADVLAGSIAINPCSAHYQRIKEVMESTYQDFLYSEDAIQLEKNSRDYLKRAAIMNRNASYIVSILQPLTQHHNPGSPLSHVYHPSTCWSAANYNDRLRAPTKEFVPGHGFLFTLEFVSLKVAKAFYDALQLHKGPSIGAQITLALPYVQVVFQKEKEWAASYGLSEAIVRISVGLEDQKELAIAVLRAMAAAESAMQVEVSDTKATEWLGSHSNPMAASRLASVV